MTQDLTMRCVECGMQFVWTAGEQVFYSERGFSRPRRCKPCRERFKERMGERSVHLFDR